MLPYPPAVRRDAAERSLVRVLGGLLASLSLLLALLGIVFHQRLPDLFLAVIAGLFALRVLLLWLGKTSQHHQPLPARPLREGSALQPTPSLLSQSLTRLPMEQHLQPGASPVPPSLPRSVRPQRQPGAATFPAQSAPPPQPGVQPLWLPHPAAALPPAPLPWQEGQGTWQYDDGNR